MLGTPHVGLLIAGLSSKPVRASNERSSAESVLVNALCDEADLCPPGHPRRDACSSVVAEEELGVSVNVELLSSFLDVEVHIAEVAVL